MRQLIITKNDAGQRLDKFLLKYMPQIPNSMLYKSLRKDCVRVNGKHIRDGAYKLIEGDELKLYMKDEFFAEEKSFIPVKTDIDIVYEDNNILIVNKKSGIVVHADDKGTELTLIEQIKSYLYNKGEYRPEQEHSFAPALCNRLDRNTSGLIIAAKNAEALRIMNEKIRLREVHKYYMCIADGIIRGSGTLSAHLTRGDKKVKISEKDNKGSKAVQLKYRAVANSENKTLLEIELLTGRTHQIRAQLASIGHPLSGDVKYGGSHNKSGYNLCSCRLEFDFKKDSGILDYLNYKTVELPHKNYTDLL